MKQWYDDDATQLRRAKLYAQGNPDEWGAGESVAEEELPPPPTNVVAKPGNKKGKPLCCSIS